MTEEMERGVEVIEMIGDQVAAEGCRREPEALTRELYNVLLELGALVGMLMWDCWIREVMRPGFLGKVKGG